MKIKFAIAVIFVSLIFSCSKMRKGETKIVVEANRVGDTTWTVYEVRDMNFTSPMEGPKLFWKLASGPFKKKEDAILFEKQIIQENDSLRLKELKVVSQND